MKKGNDGVCELDQYCLVRASQSQIHIFNTLQAKQNLSADKSQPTSSQVVTTQVTLFRTQRRNFHPEKLFQLIDRNIFLS